MTKSSIEIMNITKAGEGHSSNVTFRILGCNFINHASVIFSNGTIHNVTVDSIPCS
jgi:hypothetical protein